MGFLAPWFLAGLVAVGLPIWLHLLRRSQHNPRPFSSLMFFEKRIETSSKHRTLRYRALLAARLALLFLLALAFARPFLNRQANSVRKQRIAVIAIDRSFSMRSGERMVQAKSAAHAAVRSLPSNQAGQVLAFDRRVEQMSALEFSHAALDAAIDTVQPSDMESSYGELVRALRVLAQSKDDALDVHLVSDMQQTSMPEDFRDLSLGQTASLATHRIGSAVPNWAVESVVTAPRVYDVKRTQLTATISGWNTQASKQNVQLLLDGKPVGSQEVPVAANGHGEAEFRSFNVPFGQHRGEVRMPASDALAPDNRFVFSVERSDPRHVLFLYARGRNKQAFYYQAALQSASEQGLEVESLPVEQLANKDLARYSFVVLNDVGELDKSAEQKLCSFVMGGKAAFIALGPDTERSGRIPLSKIALRRQQETQGATIADPQNRAVAGVGNFDNVQFFITAAWKPKDGDHILARLADGSPLLVEQTMGEGRVLQFAATLDNTTADFPLHASYLPFIAQTGQYLAGGDDTAASYPAGSVITLRRGRESNSAADVIGPDGRHEVSLAQSRNNGSFEVDREGFYEVSRADGRHLLVAAHADRRESDLRTIPDETLELWRNTGSSAASQSGESGGTEIRRWSFWRYVLILALLAALVETAIARRYSEEGQRTI